MMEELRHLQLVVLEIAKDIDNLCRSNNIEYYLGGGGAIGAVRHKGYIPWDDDLDFLMTYENYEKFIKVCKTSLDTEKYTLDIKELPWSLPSCKIRLNGTSIIEPGAIVNDNGNNGIFLDIFRLEHSPKAKLLQYIQFYASKLWVAYNCAHNPNYIATGSKQIIITCSKIMNISFLRNLIKHEVEKYNNKKVSTYGCFWGITRFKNSFTEADVYGNPLYLPFENTELPLPEQYDKYLTQFFGNYMQLPPVEKRVAPHITSVNFGKY